MESINGAKIVSLEETVKRRKMTEQRNKEVLHIERLEGINQWTDENRLSPFQAKSLINILYDKEIIKTRPGTFLYPTDGDYSNFEKVYINKLGNCLVRYNKNGYVEYTQNPSDVKWIRLKFTDKTLQNFTFNTFPPNFLEFKGKLWMTNGVDPVQIWDGESVIKLLEDEIFMRGRHIVSFQHRIFLAHTPECSYNVVQSRFADDDGNNVEPDMEGAWSGEMITSIPQTIDITGFYSADDRLFIPSKGGIFVLWLEETPQLLKKISNIHCVEGNYTNTNIPIVFDESNKGYSFDGSKFNELALIKDTLLANPFRKTGEVFMVTKSDWDKGKYERISPFAKTSANLIKNNLTIALNPSAHHLVVEVPDPSYTYPVIVYPIRVKDSLYLGQSFIIREMVENNIGYYINRISPYISNSSDVNATVKLYVLKYNAPPEKMGDAGYEIIGEKEITLNAYAAGDINFDFDEPIKIDSNIPYYIAVVETSSTGEVDWHSSGNVNIYDDGLKYSNKATNGDFAFKIYIAKLCPSGSYLSPVFHAPNILHGLLFSISIDEADLGAIEAKFRSASSEGELADASWQSITDPLYRLNLTNILTSTLTYFQFIFHILNNSSFKTPIIYATKITYLTQEGQINTFTFEDKNYLLLKNCTLVATPDGWYQYSLKLNSLTDWQNDLWATTSEKITYKDETEHYYYLKLDESKLKDFHDTTGYGDNTVWNTQDIDGEWKTGRLDFGHPMEDKILRKIRILFETNLGLAKSQEISLNLKYRYGYVEKTLTITKQVQDTGIQKMEKAFPESVEHKWFAFTLNFARKDITKIKLVEFIFEIRRR